jgi:hypothetical protein
VQFKYKQHRWNSPLVYWIYGYHNGTYCTQALGIVTTTCHRRVRAR